MNLFLELLRQFNYKFVAVELSDLGLAGLAIQSQKKLAVPDNLSNAQVLIRMKHIQELQLLKDEAVFWAYIDGVLADTCAL